MRPFDPRHWNLLPSTLLLAAACNPEQPADTTGTDESGSSMDDTEGGLGFECYSEPECPPEEACISLYCRTYSIPDECELPPLVEIPLPELPSFQEAAFADVDGDGDDEVLLLLDDGVAVLHDDDSVTTTMWPMPLPDAPQEMVALALDGDEAVDLVAFSLGGEALVALGDGAGGLMAIGLVDLPRLLSPVAIDLDLDGVDEVAGIDFDTNQPLLFEDLLGLSDASIELDDDGLETATGLTVLQANDDASPDLLIDGVCQAKLLYGPDLSTSDLLSDPNSPHGSCQWRAVAFTFGEPESPFALMEMQSSPQSDGWLQRWHLPDLAYQYTALPKTYSAVGVISPTPSATAIVLVAKSDETLMIWDWAEDGTACQAELPVSSPTFLRFAVGHRDVGTRNFLTYSGEAKLWSLDP